MTVKLYPSRSPCLVASPPKMISLSPRNANQPREQSRPQPKKQSPRLPPLEVEGRKLLTKTTKKLKLPRKREPNQQRQSQSLKRKRLLSQRRKSLRRNPQKRRGESKIQTKMISVGTPQAVKKSHQRTSLPTVQVVGMMRASQIYPLALSWMMAVLLKRHLSLMFPSPTPRTATLVLTTSLRREELTTLPEVEVPRPGLENSVLKLQLLGRTDLQL